MYREVFRWRSLITVIVLVFVSIPAFSTNKDMVELQTQVQMLADQVSRMQDFLSTNVGVISDSVRKTNADLQTVKTKMAALQQTLQAVSDDKRLDQLSQQIQTLNASLTDLQSEMAAVGKRMDNLDAAVHQISAPPASTEAAPPADVLYSQALNDYEAAKYQLSAQEFRQYLATYPNQSQAASAQFYLADSDYWTGNYAQAVSEFDALLKQYPGTETAAAGYKKGLALIKLGQRAAGIKQLREVVASYPESPAALQARSALDSLKVSAAASPSLDQQ